MASLRRQFLQALYAAIANVVHKYKRLNFFVEYWIFMNTLYSVSYIVLVVFIFGAICLGCKVLMIISVRLESEVKSKITIKSCRGSNFERSAFQNSDKAVSRTASFTKIQ